MKTTFAIGFDKGGNLLLQNERGGDIHSAPCPFAASFKPCGKWCVHCGTMLFEGNYVALDLTCGNGTRLLATQEVKGAAK